MPEICSRNDSMEVDKHEWKVLQNALHEWEERGMLTSAKVKELKNVVGFKKTGRQMIAQYFFFIALFCTLLAFGALFINEKLLERIKVYFSWSDMVIAGITALLGIAWFWYSSRRRPYIAPDTYEIYMVLGGLTVVTSLVYICKQLHTDATYTTFLSLCIFTLASLSMLLHSRALWLGALLSAIGWFGTFSTWLSADSLFLGMNYPVRYTVFGLVLLGLSFLQQRIRPFAFTHRLTYVIAMALFFVGLWGMSIFGNYNSFAGWQQVRQVHVLAYSIVFAAGAAISFYLGIRYRDDLARDFGILFLLLNLYTRYFEYFWDTINKGIFFLILAITFGLLGRWLQHTKRKSNKGIVPVGALPDEQVG